MYTTNGIILKHLIQNALFFFKEPTKKAKRQARAGTSFRLTKPFFAKLSGLAAAKVPRGYPHAAPRVSLRCALGGPVWPLLRVSAFDGQKTNGQSISWRISVAQ